MLEIFLNFVAVEFVANIDNLAFSLALRGYVKDEFIKTAHAVQRVKFYHFQGHRRTCMRRIIFYSILFALFSGWVVINRKQRDGFYLEKIACKSFSINFGDEFYNVNTSIAANDVYDLNGTRNGDPTLRYYLSNDASLPSPLFYAAFSGTYVIRKDSKNSHIRKKNRFVYYEDLHVEGSRNATDPTLGRFSYCDTLEAWVFEIEALSKIVSDEDGCENTWLLRSPKSESFLLENLPTSGWTIRSDGLLTITTEFTFVCNECNSNHDCNDGECNVDNGQCDCNEGYLGNKCDVQTFCNSLEFFHYGSSAFEFDRRGDFGSFSLFNTTRTTTANVNFLTSYGRPVYITKPFRNYDDFEEDINDIAHVDADGKLVFFDDLYSFNDDCQVNVDKNGTFKGFEDCLIRFEEGTYRLELKVDENGDLFFEDVYAAVFTGTRWYGVEAILANFIDRFIEEPFHGYW